MATKTRLGGFDDDGEWLRRFWELAAPRDLGAAFEAAKLFGDQVQAIRALQEGFAAARWVPKFDLPKVMPEFAIQRRLAIADAWKPLVATNFDKVLRELIETASQAAAARVDQLDEEELAQFYGTLADVSERLERDAAVAADTEGGQESGPERLTRYQKLNLLLMLASLLIMIYLGTVGSDGGPSVSVENQLNVEHLQINIEEVHIDAVDDQADFDELEERVSRVIAEVVARLPEDALDQLSEAATSELESLEDGADQADAGPMPSHEVGEEE